MELVYHKKFRLWRRLWWKLLRRDGFWIEAIYSNPKAAFEKVPTATGERIGIDAVGDDTITVSRRPPFAS